MTKEDGAIEQRGSKRCGGKPLKKGRGKTGRLKPQERKGRELRKCNNVWLGK